MRFDIMTLFPELVKTVLGESIIGRAQKSGAIEVICHNIRDFSEDKHRRVDDTPYGGGKGMLMMAPPIYNCFQSIVEQAPASDEKPYVVFMSPAGKLFNQRKAEELAAHKHIVILCGHYEGVDERALELEGQRERKADRRARGPVLQAERQPPQRAGRIQAVALGEHAAVEHDRRQKEHYAEGRKAPPAIAPGKARGSTREESVADEGNRLDRIQRGHRQARNHKENILIEHIIFADIRSHSL